MREPRSLILTALSGELLYGYAMIQEVSAPSQDRVRLKAGTSYEALDRLVKEGGLVFQGGQEVVQGRLRRYEDLSGSGVQHLAEATRRLWASTAAVTCVLQVRGVTA